MSSSIESARSALLSSYSLEETLLTERRRRSAAKESLLAFAEYTHPRWETGAHHRVICDFLDRVYRGEIKRGIIQAPPRHTKSELASRRFPAWWLGNRPSDQIITATYATDFAVDFGADVREIVSSQECRNVFPGLQLNPDRKAASRWRTTDGGIYVAAGVGGPITGRGAHLAIIDDPIKNRADAQSKRMREKTWQWFWSTLHTRLMPNAAILLMMTRWHPDDLAGRLIKQGGWELLDMPAIAHEDTDHEEALWPEWYPLDALHAKREKMPRREWVSLYQQRPAEEGGDYIKGEWIANRYSQLPKSNLYLVTDPAATDEEEYRREHGDEGGRGPDYTEHGVFGFSSDENVYAVDWWNGRVESSVWIAAAIDIIKRHKISCWFMPKGVIKRVVEGQVKRMMREAGVFCRVEYFAEVNDKYVKGMAFQGLAQMGRWHFPEAPWADRVVEQCTQFPAEFDDAFDVCADFGMLINTAHPAVKPKAVDHDDRDEWDDSGKKTRNWRTA
jgi:predicted phage terminase large subunit-like protein